MRPSQRCQTKGRLWNRLQCCSKKLLRSQSSSVVPGLAPASVEQLGLQRRGPFRPEGGPQDLAQPLGGGRLAPDGGDGDDAVVVGQGVEVVRLLIRPAVAEQPGHGDLERVGRALRVALEEPLGRVVAVGLGETVRVFLGGDLLPAFEVERNLDEGGVCDVQLLINPTNGVMDIREICRSTKSREVSRDSRER